MKKFLVRILLLILIFGQFGLIVYLLISSYTAFEKVAEYENKTQEKLTFVQTPPNDLSKTDLENIRAVEKLPKDIASLQITGWIPDWDFDDGFDTLIKNEQEFYGVSPFWYELLPDGSLKKTAPAERQDFIDFAKANDIELIPTITTFDAAVMSGMLNSQENINRHVNEIMGLIRTYDFDGIDLDYESTYLKDKELFFKFLQQLSIEMVKEGKKLVFTALSKWGDKDVHYTGLPETRKVQDYKRISDLVDELRIMTYEYTGRNSDTFGPNAPVAWIEDVIRYAISEGVPREKLVMGIPTYSYDYTQREQMQTLDYYPVLRQVTDKGLEPGLAYYNTTIDEIIAAYSPQITFNEAWGEAVLAYTFEGTQRVIVYPTSKSIEIRKQLAADYGIKGVAFWRLGDEGSLEL